MKTEVVFDTNDLDDILPHRYPFRLLDRVVEFIDGERIVGVKNVTINEPFFVGHFPGRPVMPGALIFEAIAQTACVLAKKSTGGMRAESYCMLVGTKGFKWKRQVVPGDTLIIEVEFEKKRGIVWQVKGTASVAGDLVATGTISAAEVIDE